MIMKSKNIINILYLVIVSAVLSSCSKSDSPYYEYENELQVYNGNALQYLQAQPSGTFDSLLVVLNRLPDLMDSLENQKITLFTPINKNFEYSIKYLNIKRKNAGKTPKYLADLDIDQLDTMICKYIIRGEFVTDNYLEDVDGLLLRTIETGYPMHIRYEKMSSSGFVGGGASTLIFSETFGSSFTKDWVRTKASTVNIRTNNAVINVLDAVHTFGFDEFTRQFEN